MNFNSQLAQRSILAYSSCKQLNTANPNRNIGATRNLRYLALVKSNCFINCCITYCMTKSRTRASNFANKLTGAEFSSEMSEEKEKEEEIVKETEPETQTV